MHTHGTIPEFLRHTSKFQLISAQLLAGERNARGGLRWLHKRNLAGLGTNWSATTTSDANSNVLSIKGGAGGQRYMLSLRPGQGCLGGEIAIGDSSDVNLENARRIKRLIDRI